MLTLRSRIFAIISIAVLVILAIAITLILFSQRSSTPSGGNNSPVATAGADEPAQAGGGENILTSFDGLQVQKPATEAVEKNAVKQLAKIFIERYASYSTDNDFQNIKELQGLTTDKLWQDLSRKIGASTASGFVGVTTKAVVSTFSSWDRAKSAVVSVQATQTEERNGQTNILHKNVNVTVLKVKDQWLVDKFEWTQ